MTERKTRPRAGHSDVPSAAGICPHLGIEEDLQTCLAYPSSWNLCHRARPASIIRLGHQRKTCLSPAYMSCPVFQCRSIAPLPAELRGQRSNAKKAASKKPYSP